MELTPDQIADMARIVGLEPPAADRANIALRLSNLLTQMETIEHELGALMDETDPVPPVYPHEPQD